MLAEFAAACQPTSFCTRYGDPTVEVLERVVADLEGGQCGLAFSSGMAAISLGGGETLVEHPASMSRALLSEQELQQAGIPLGLIRMSVGIEGPDDLIADLHQALEQVRGQP